jgi:uncharacterized membrane protein YcjF (UPF0283 family)
VPNEASATFIRSPWRTTFWLLATLAVVWLGHRAITDIYALWHQPSWLALPVTLLTIALVGTATWASWREIRAMRRVDALDDRDKRIKEAIETDSIIALKDALSPTITILRERQPELIQEFEAAATNRVCTGDYADLFGNLILKELDEQAEALIKRTSFTVGAAVAILPHPTLDAAVVLWKATTLIRRIGDIYGLELTGLSSLKLFKHAVTSAVLAAGVEEIGNAVLEQLGRGVMESAGKKGAEGLVIAGRVYRLGKLTQELCRPGIQSAG